MSEKRPGDGVVEAPAPAPKRGRSVLGYVREICARYEPVLRFCADQRSCSQGTQFALLQHRNGITEQHSTY